MAFDDFLMRSLEAYDEARFAESLAWLSGVLALDGGTYLINAGNAAYEMGCFEAAAAIFELAARLGDDDALLNQAASLNAAGLKEEALEPLVRAQLRGDRRALGSQVLLLLELGRISEAHEKVITATPGEEHAFCDAILSWWEWNSTHDIRLKSRLKAASGLFEPAREALLELRTKSANMRVAKRSK